MCGAYRLLEGGGAEPHAKGRLADRQVHQSFQDPPAYADRPGPCGVYIVTSLSPRENHVLRGLASCWHAGRRLLHRHIIGDNLEALMMRRGVR